MPDSAARAQIDAALTTLFGSKTLVLVLRHMHLLGDHGATAADIESLAGMATKDAAARQLRRLEEAGALYASSPPGTRARYYHWHTHALPHALRAFLDAVGQPYRMPGGATTDPAPPLRTPGRRPRRPEVTESQLRRLFRGLSAYRALMYLDAHDSATLREIQHAHGFHDTLSGRPLQMFVDCGILRTRSARRGARDVHRDTRYTWRRGPVSDALRVLLRTLRPHLALRLRVQLYGEQPHRRRSTVPPETVSSGAV